MPTPLPTPAVGPGPSPAARPGRIALVACGAIARPAAQAAARHGWPIDVHPLPPLLHNHPERIAGQAELLLDELAGRYDRFAIGYADCGTYGAIDELCERRGVRRLAGLHCYDLFAGAPQMEATFEAEPGTYVFTDFLVESFERTVVRELGLDRYPELREDYFGHYTRVVWLAQEPTPARREAAQRAADRMGLPLQVVVTGTNRLDEAMADLLDPDDPRPPAPGRRIVR